MFLPESFWGGRGGARWGGGGGKGGGFKAPWLDCFFVVFFFPSSKQCERCRCTCGADKTSPAGWNRRQLQTRFSAVAFGQKDNSCFLPLGCRRMKRKTISQLKPHRAPALDERDHCLLGGKSGAGTHAHSDGDPWMVPKHIIIFIMWHSQRRRQLWHARHAGTWSPALPPIPPPVTLATNTHYSAVFDDSSKTICKNFLTQYFNITWAHMIGTKAQSD